MQVDEVLIRRLISAMASRVIAQADELTILDQAIGDGDHGLNMNRGFQALLADLDKTAQLPLPQALQAVGTTLVMKVGGASGPLYGTLFMAAGKALPAQPTREEAIKAFGAPVKARGKSQAGQKTMLDVLIPAHAALLEGRPIRIAVTEAAAATIPLKASRGRASFLGDRSIGHMDPGARSSQLIIEAVFDTLEGST
jgi:phosphoenolpyruvate---glycerone phosphotransferase subunit DhaL